MRIGGVFPLTERPDNGRGGNLRRGQSSELCSCAAEVEAEIDTRHARQVDMRNSQVMR